MLKVSCSSSQQESWCSALRSIFLVAEFGMVASCVCLLQGLQDYSAMVKPEVGAGHQGELCS